MAILPLNLARVSNLLRSSLANQSIAQTQSQLLEVQNELSTGKRVNQPSDDPSSAAIIQQLQKALETRQGYSSNINQAKSQLGEVDSTLGDLNNLLQEAQQIASQNVSSTVSNEQRTSAASVIDSIYNQALTLANKQFEGSYLFGGDLQTDPPYVQATGGVQFVGATNTLANTFDQATQLGYQVAGTSVFGGQSSRITGSANLSPSLSATTRIGELKGAGNTGVHLGSIQISDGTTTKVLDLSGADQVGDIASIINGAGLTGVTASVSAVGFTLTASAGANITVNEVGGGSTAADLGIFQPAAAGANISLVGGNVRATVTPLTLVSALRSGAGVDPTGFTITNGQLSKAITIPPGTTVEGLLNAINNAGVGVHAQVNATHDGIDILNTVQGTTMSISENGGTSASDLGLRSFGPNTPLSQLNDGKGVGTVAGNDFDITTADGTLINVDLNNPVTVQDVLNQINAAAGPKLTASFTTTGNGIVLTDNTVGGGALKVTPLNFSTAATDLGIMTPAAGGVITGSDVNGIKTPGIFSNLQKLRDSLRTSDLAGITTAAEGLTSDSSNVVQVRGTTGAKVQELTSRSNRIDDENLASKALLSQLQDADMASTITQFQTLQNSLQATLQTTAKTINLSLLDYLG